MPSCDCLVDIDECKNHDCGGEGVCTNTQGSFKCECDFGYEKNEKYVCVGKSGFLYVFSGVN